MSEQIQTQWTADRILSFLEEHAGELKDMGVVKLALFGSYVRDEQKPTSDLDFLLLIDNWTWKRWCRVWNFLEASFDVTVDLIPEDDLRPELQARVLAEARYVSLN